MEATASRNVVVSGGGTGIGRAVAAAFAGAGDTVAVIGRRRDVLEGVAAAHETVVPMVADVTDPQPLRRLRDDLHQTFGTVDVLVANAGASDKGPAETLEEVAEHWRASLWSNLMSAVLLEHALRGLLRRPGGRVVAISSATTHGGGEVAYAASKAALNRWIVQLASDLGADGITANAVSPGFVPDTELYGGPVDADVRDKLARGIAVRRPGAPEDVAAAVRYVASEEAGFISGSVLDIDGGRRVPNPTFRAAR